MKRTPLVALLLAAWLGAGILVAAVVAPAAFAVLPSRELAGALVGRVLPVIFLAGIIVALAGLLLDRASVGRHPRVRRVALVVIATACAAAQFSVAPRIETVRRQINGPVDQLPAGDPKRVAFGRLHAESVAWLGLAMLGAAGVMLLASLPARVDAFTARGQAVTATR